MIGLLLIYATVLLVNSVNVNGDSLCSICNCTNETQLKQNFNFTLIKCDGNKNSNLETLIDLKDPSWPTSHRDMKYFVQFINLKINYLPQILGNPNVIGLDLTNISIRTVDANPFINFPNIEEITLRNNKLFGIEEWFETNKNLTYLGLSNTSISELRPHCVEHLKHLYELDLSHNSILKLSFEFFEAIKSVHTLNVHHNKIYFVESVSPNHNNNRTTAQLRYLDLSYNKLTVITSRQFDNFIYLETLLLQENQIANIDGSSFVNLQILKIINLSFNSLTEIGNLKNASTIKELHLNNNQIKNWEMTEIPNDLIELYVQSNNLNSFIGNFDSLKIFNFSNNSLSVLPNIIFKSLEIFDLSYNRLTAVPQGMAERTPVLDTLILDNNPIDAIRFVDNVKLRRLSLNHMPLIKNIDYETFKNIEETGSHSSGNITCMELEMSNCPYLSQIDTNALEHVNLCKLDLSYNKFRSLPENLTNWSIIENGINLQGNPFICECSIQWMLETVVEQLYNNKSNQYLLRELRCDQPKLFANNRFIKFYRRGDIFCNADSAKMAQLKTLDDYGIDRAGFGPLNIDLSQRPSYITIIVSSIVLLVAMIGLGFYWMKQQRKQLGNNRRFT